MKYTDKSLHRQTLGTLLRTILIIIYNVLIDFNKIIGRYHLSALFQVLLRYDSALRPLWNSYKY